MVFTVRELVEIPLLKTRFLGGEGGGSRAVRWAHSCELSAPWEWLSRDDLLMTNGFTVPKLAEGQVAFVRQLDAVGIAGVAIGEDLHAPDISDAMLSEADRLRFPVLSTAYDVPFIAVAQAVAQANRYAEQERMTLTMRIYDAVRQGGDAGPLAIMRRIGADLAADLHVVDCIGDPLLDGDQMEGRLREQVVAVIDERAGKLPAIMRVPDGDRVALLVPVPSWEFACLVVRPYGDTSPALALLQHVAAVVAIEIERRSARDESRRRLGSELLAHLVDRRIDAESGGRQLADFELGGTEMVVLAVEARDGGSPDVLHRELRRAGVASLQLRRSTTVYLLLPSEAVSRVEGSLGDEVAAGHSCPISAVGEVPHAAKEACWALEAARGRHRRMVRYGRTSPPFMPRTVSEARTAADEVLGELLAYDAEHAGNLVDSLRTFLAANRSWQRAARGLGVHKQTLVYRMRRVEELTGRHLTDTGDVAQLWLALHAHDLLSDLDESESPVGGNGASGMSDQKVRLNGR